MDDTKEVEEFICNKTVADINCTIDEKLVLAEDASPENVLVPATLGVVFIVGVAANAFLLWFIVHVKRRNPHILLMGNLATSDLAMLVIGMPFVSTIYTFEDWPYGLFVCKLSEFAQTLSASAAVLSLTALSADRFFILSGRKTRSSLKSSIILISVIWLTSIFIALPDFISSTIFTFGTMEFCVVYPDSLGTLYTNIHVIMKFIYLFVLPMMAIATFYILIAIKLSTNKELVPATNSRLLMRNETPSNDKTSLKTSRIRVTFAVLALVVVFVITWLPRYVFLMWYHFDPSDFDEFWHVFKITSFCLMFINSLINPFIYCALDNSFRRRLLSLLKCRLYQSHDTSNAELGSDYPEQMTMTVITKHLDCTD